MTTTIELMHITVNDAFTADPSVFDKLRAGAQKAGIVNQSYGYSIDDPKQLYWILHFDQGFEPKDLWNTAGYAEFEAEMSRISTKKTSVYLPFEPASTETIKAPVTEIVLLTLKEGLKLEDFKPVMAAFREKNSGIIPTRHSSTSASSNDRALWLFVGWDSKEEYTKFSERPELLEYRGKVAEYIDPSAPPKMALVKFTDHQ